MKIVYNSDTAKVATAWRRGDLSARALTDATQDPIDLPDPALDAHALVITMKNVPKAENRGRPRLHQLFKAAMSFSTSVVALAGKSLKPYNADEALFGIGYLR